MTNREIDALVAEKVMGKLNVREFRGRYVWDNVGYVNGEPTADVMGVVDVPEYSTNISDAWQVVEKIQQEYFFNLICGRESGFKDGKIGFYCEIGFYENAGEVEWDADGSTAPMAICLAALKVKEVNI